MLSMANVAEGLTIIAKMFSSLIQIESNNNFRNYLPSLFINARNPCNLRNNNNNTDLYNY